MSISTAPGLTNGGTGSVLQITGLASGINTNAIIQAELAQEEAPVNAMQNQISGMENENSQLTSIQTALQNVYSDIQNLGSVSLFFPTQNVTSSDSSLISASSTGGVGGVIGSSTIEVSQLASAAQRTFSFTSPAAQDTITIDGQQLTLAAGSTSTDLANAINGSNTLDVWASATNSGQIVLSNRATGAQTGSYIQVSDTQSALVENTSLANAGQNAQYTINGTAGSSASDTVTGAIPGVTLTLNGVTGTSNPVTVTVQPPGPDTASITQAVQQFVTDYNAAIGQIEGAVNTTPASESNSSSYNPNSGSLFGDPELENFLGDMRSALIQPGAGLPTGMAALSDIGITTGTSNGTLDQSAIQGNLTLNTQAFQQALQSNPNGVQALLQSWSQSFGNLVNNEGGPGGNLQTRINGNSDMVTQLQNQYNSLQTMFAQEQQNMQAQWAQVEGVLSQLKAQSSALTSFAASAASSSSSSSSSSTSSSSGLFG